LSPKPVGIKYNLPVIILEVLVFFKRVDGIQLKYTNYEF